MAPPTSDSRVSRWRYVIPNAITMAGLVLALSAIVLSFAGDHWNAAWLIVLIVLIDKLDGTAARLLRATSDIGVQLDSFADFVSFGIAPGALVFSMIWQPGEAGGVGPGPGAWSGTLAYVAYGLCAAYVLCACFRLAKFNVLADEISDDSPKVFYGMPSTQAGGIMAATIILALKYELTGVLAAMPVIAAGLGILMVSTLPLPKIGPRKTKALNAFQLVNVVFGYACGILRILPEYLWALLVLYALIGFGWGIAHRSELAPKRLDPYPT